MTHPLSEAGTSVAVKPCPHCGGEGKTCRNGGVVYVVCLDCHSQGPSKSTSHPQVVAEAIEAWNRRAVIQGVEPIGFVDRNFLAAIKVQGRTEPLTIWAESYALEHVPIYASPTPPPIGDGEGDLVARLRAAVDIGTRTGARGQHASNIYNLADEAVAAIESLSRQLEEAREALTAADDARA